MHLVMWHCTLAMGIRGFSAKLCAGDVIAGLLTHLAGIPTAVVLAGTSLRTTEFAPTFTLSPSVMLPKTRAPAPMKQPLPSVGCRFPVYLPVPPRVTFW